MKFSSYLSFVPIGKNRIIAYNAIQDQFAILRNLDIDDLKACDKLKNADDSTYNSFIEKGWIIPESKDETALVEELIQKHDNDNSEFHLHINPTLDCNFNCWYCYENHIKGSRMSPEIIDSTKRAITNICKNPSLKVFRLGFFGGEPLLGFNDVCIPIIKHAEKECLSKDIKFTVQFTSNGFLITQPAIDFLKSYETYFQITIDGDKETHNKIRFGKNNQESFDVIISNVKKLLSNGINVILRYNYTIGSIEKIKNITPILDDIPEESKKRLTLDLQRVWQDDDKDDYSKLIEIIDDISSGFEEIGITVKDMNIFDFVRNSCYGDKNNYALINFDGRLFSCTARDFCEENSTGTVSETGELVWNEKKAYKMTRKFTREICRSCKIAPICGGGCRQNHINHPDGNYCIWGSETTREERIKDIILARFETFCINRQNS